MTKFHELSDASQQAAVQVLSQVINRAHEGTGDVDASKLKWKAHAIREAFASLEGERPTVGDGESD